MLLFKSSYVRKLIFIFPCFYSETDKTKKKMNWSMQYLDKWLTLFTSFGIMLPKEYKCWANGVWLNSIHNVDIIFMCLGPSSRRLLMDITSEQLISILFTTTAYNKFHFINLFINNYIYLIWKPYGSLHWF